LKDLGSALLLVALGGSAPAFSQVPCRVLDLEIAATYKGGCKDGLAEGHGEAAGPDAQYRGEFRAGRKHGKGIKRWKNGDQYEGAFVEDRKEGNGTYTWGPNGAAAGERYSGEYRGDRRHGYGIYTWPSGDRYAGTWDNDTITGAPTPGMLSRARSQKEADAAIAGSGSKVCRWLQIGISEEDLIIGEVIDTKQGEIEVRIQTPGRFRNSLNGVDLSRGTVVWDSVRAWSPCR
jgi:hypothetical protein